MVYRRQHWVPMLLITGWLWGGLASSVVYAADMAAGKKAYGELCQSCHGAHGIADPKIEKMLQMSIPPVSGAALASKDDAEMLRIIAEGAGKMPGYAKQLSAEAQRSVLDYMKSLGQQ